MKKLTLVLVFSLMAFFGAMQSAYAAAEVYTVTPAFSPFNAVGRAVTLKGIGFTPTSVVDFSGIPAVTFFIDSRTLVATVPVVGSAQVITVGLTDPSNGSDSFFPFLYTEDVLYVSTTGSDGNSGTSPALPKLTIAAAMAAASGTDPSEIRVEAGRYPESQLALPHVTVLSCGWAVGFGLRDPDGNVTEIDGRRRGFVIRSSGLQNISVVDGCTISNGHRDGLGGGGLAVSADSMVVNDNVIVGNSTSSRGGAVYFTSSTRYGGITTLSNNLMVGNRAYNKNGGAVAMYPDYNSQLPVKLKISANEIVGNRSYGGTGGGVAFLSSTYVGYNSVSLAIADNVIYGNDAKSGAGVGIDLVSFGDLLTLSMNNNLVVANATPGTGGGLSIQGAGALDGHVRSNTMTLNTAAFGQGGGFLIGGAVNLLPTFSAENMILWGNVGGDVAGQAVSEVVFSDSGTPLGGSGNISSDPSFVSGPMGDFYLAQNNPPATDSPAVDAGSDTAASLSMENLTTRTDSAMDGGIVDLGYHNQTDIGNSPVSISFNRLDPGRGDFNGTSWVLVRGDGFDPGVAVTFDSVPVVDSIYLGHRRVLVKPAPHAEGFVNVRITNPDASFADLFSAFIYLDNQPPIWNTTTGIVSGISEVDTCQRTVHLDWNEAIDLDTPPVIYEVYREECIVSVGFTVPCDNFSFIPNSTNFLASTTATTLVDGVIPGSQDKKWVYAVRAIDSAVFGPNREWNFGKRVVTGAQGSIEVPPSEVGDSVVVTLSAPDTFVWTAPSGAVDYGLYRETDPSQYATPGSLTKLILLNVLNNDADANGITDNSYQDSAMPAPGQIFNYRVSALDTCGTETISEL
jgi:hypothetical protein